MDYTAVRAVIRKTLDLAGEIDLLSEYVRSGSCWCKGYTGGYGHEPPGSSLKEGPDVGCMLTRHVQLLPSLGLASAVNNSLARGHTRARAAHNCLLSGGTYRQFSPMHHTPADELAPEPPLVW